MRKLIVLISSFCPLLCLSQEALNAPFTILGPRDAMIYTDLKTAYKDAETCYKLDLRDQVIDTAKLFHKLNKLVNLQVFAIGNNGLSSLPDELSGLNAMIYFSSTGNPLKKFSKNFGDLRNLTYMELHNTDMDSIPMEIGYLSKLKIFHIQNNTDTLGISFAIGYLPLLNDLLIYNSHIDSIPNDIGKSRSLKRLSIVKCGLDTLPSSLGNMSMLEQLVLDQNRLTELPSSVYHMKNLKYLSIKANKFTRIPPEICFLTSLETLDIRGNQVSDYDAEIIKRLLPKGCEVIYK
jgi:Leucine-rich repeat (LRR) protein